MKCSGYMPPEYINRQKISPKFDVFSLGVIIIQIMAGKEGYYSFPYSPQKEFIKNVRKKISYHGKHFFHKYFIVLYPCSPLLVLLC